MSFSNRILCLSIFIFSVSCSRDVQKASTSLISLKTPASSANNSGISSLEAIPANRKICYGVSIKGPGINSLPASSCSPELGIVAGFVSAGALLEAQVPLGTNRNISLYLFLQNEGENIPCPQMGANIAASQLSQIYKVGESINVTLSKEVETVDIVLNFPGVSNNIAKQFALPASCTAIALPEPNMPRFQINAGSQISSGAGIKLFGRAGKVSESQFATGSGIKLKVR